MFGRNGDDDIFGGSGADFLVGGLGNDELYGGLGADKFRFLSDMDEDIVFDFTDNVDTLSFDDALWGGGLSEMQVVDTFATVVADETILDFGAGNILTVIGVTDITLLYDDIEIF